MSATFDIIPLDEHPDRELLAHVAVLDEWHARFDAARGDRAKKRLLREADCRLIATTGERLAATQARTMVGLIAKSDCALRSWRDDDGPERYYRLHADIAMCLEQAIATLRSLDVMPEPVIVAITGDGA